MSGRESDEWVLDGGWNHLIGLLRFVKDREGMSVVVVAGVQEGLTVCHTDKELITPRDRSPERADPHFRH